MVKQEHKFLYPECNDMFRELEAIKKYDTKVKATRYEDQVYMMMVFSDIKVEEAYKIMCKWFKEKIINAQALSDNIMFLSYDKKPEVRKPNNFEATLYIDTWAKTLTFRGKSWMMAETHNLKDRIEWMLAPEIVTRFSKMRSI